MTKQKFVDTDTKEATEEHLKVVNHQTAALWATDCTEHIIHYFEQKYPQDVRLRKAIAAGRAWVKGEIGVVEARKAAHAAAREADDNAAIATARSAGQAVATAHMFGHAIYASTYAVKSVAYATNFDAIAVANERTWQYQHLLDLGKTV
ncbi:MAG: putative immunity protein [Bacillota bacterium]